MLMALLLPIVYKACKSTANSEYSINMCDGDVAHDAPRMVSLSTLKRMQYLSAWLPIRKSFDTLHEKAPINYCNQRTVN